jgi:diaminopimelate decarboxylase
MDIARAERVGQAATKISTVHMIGIHMHMHIGSQITSTEQYASAIAKGVELVDRLQRMRHPIPWYHMGRGYGIDYKGREAKAIKEFA